MAFVLIGRRKHARIQGRGHECICCARLIGCLSGRGAPEGSGKAIVEEHGCESCVYEPHDGEGVAAEGPEEAEEGDEDVVHAVVVHVTLEARHELALVLWGRELRKELGDRAGRGVPLHLGR